ncbi:MAG TPA: c-type cytochrome [Polyangiaceae bacterium]|nr:c-type cytochrome [Polyangiaceae bacterium]
MMRDGTRPPSRAAERRARAVALVLGLGLVAGCGRGAGEAVDAGGPDAGPSAARGQFAVAVRQCGACHQSPNAGEGVLSGQDAPVPGTRSYGSNLTPDPDTGMDAWDAGSIAASVLRSVDGDGRPLCPAMPAYADAGMGADEALDIAAYLQSLAPAWHLVPPSACPPLKPAGDAGP